jgi:hypothetical protein
MMMGDSSKRRGCFQFSLRSFLVVMTVAAIGCGLLFGAPIVFGFLLLFFLFTAAPLVLTIAIVYGRGYLRTFAIGAMFPGFLALLYSYVLLASGFDGLDDDDLESRIYLSAYLVGLFVVLALYGGFAMLIRWTLERWQTKWAEPEPAASVPESPFDADMSSE